MLIALLTSTRNRVWKLQLWLLCELNNAISPCPDTRELPFGQMTSSHAEKKVKCQRLLIEAPAGSFR